MEKMQRRHEERNEFEAEAQIANALERERGREREGVAQRQ